MIPKPGDFYEVRSRPSHKKMGDAFVTDLSESPISGMNVLECTYVSKAKTNVWQTKVNSYMDTTISYST